MSPESQLESFIDKYSPEIGALAREIRARMRMKLPSALELVYDNYNGLVIGFSPTERASDSIFSITLYPRWINLFFLQWTPDFPDPDHIMKGSGKQVRHIRIEHPDALEEPDVSALMEAALQKASVQLDPNQPHRLIIKSISENQRPRRPSVEPPTR